MPPQTSSFNKTYQLAHLVDPQDTVNPSHELLLFLFVCFFFAFDSTKPNSDLPGHAEIGACFEQDKPPSRANPRFEPAQENAASGGRRRLPGGHGPYQLLTKEGRQSNTMSTSARD